MPLLIGKKLPKRFSESVNQSVCLLGPQRIGYFGTPVLHLRSVRLVEMPEALGAPVQTEGEAPSVLAR